MVIAGVAGASFSDDISAEMINKNKNRGLAATYGAYSIYTSTNFPLHGVDVPSDRISRTSGKRKHRVKSLEQCAGAITLRVKNQTHNSAFRCCSKLYIFTASRNSPRQP